MATASRAAAPAEADKDEPARPLAFPSPSVAVHPAAPGDVEDAAARRSTQYLRRRRCALCCCGCCVTTVVITALTVLVLAVTVFRVKHPRITMNSVTLAALSGAGPSGTLAANSTLAADVSIRNPNVASFRFSLSETEVYYEGRTVAVARVPAGRIGAHRTARVNVTVDLLADRLARAVDGGGLVMGREYEFTTYTEMSGTVRVLGVYRKELEIRMNCSVTVEVGGAASVLVSRHRDRDRAGVQSKGVSCVASVS